MTDTMTGDRSAERRKIEFLSAYLECSPAMREIVDSQIRIYKDDSSTEDERSLAMDVILEAIFPGDAADVQTGHAQALAGPEAASARSSIAQEQERFSAAVRQKMSDLGLTEEKLAQAIGVTPTALANILGRHCRPQRKTVIAISSALGVQPAEIWKDCSE